MPDLRQQTGDAVLGSNPDHGEPSQLSSLLSRPFPDEPLNPRRGSLQVGQEVSSGANELGAAAGTPADSDVEIPAESDEEDTPPHEARARLEEELSQLAELRRQLKE